MLFYFILFLNGSHHVPSGGKKTTTDDDAVGKEEKKRENVCRLLSSFQAISWSVLCGKVLALVTQFPMLLELMVPSLSSVCLSHSLHLSHLFSQSRSIIIE